MADGSVAPADSTLGVVADPDRMVEIATLEVDLAGKVYTTEDLGLGEARRFISAWSADGTLQADVRSPKMNLSRNFCHDASYKIELDPTTDAL